MGTPPGTPISPLCVLAAPDIGGSTELIGLHGRAGRSPQDPDPESVPRGSTPRCSQPPHQAALKSPQDSVDKGKRCRWQRGPRNRSRPGWDLGGRAPHIPD